MYDRLATACREEDEDAIEEASNYLCALALQKDGLTLSALFQALRKILEDQRDMIDKGGFCLGD